MNPSLARLVYLAVEHRPTLPPRKVLRFAAMAPMLSALSSAGLAGAHAELDISKDQMTRLYNEGKIMGRGNDKEFKLLLAQQLSLEVEMKRDDMPMTVFWEHMATLSEYVSGDGTALIDSAEASLADVPDYTPINKWATGFEPLDALTGGFYQGIFMVMGLPGSGKTTLCLAIMEALRKMNEASELWFYQTEIPLNLMLYRNMPSRRRVKFLDEDRIICGMPTMQDIIERVQENPNPERIIFIDSPDVMAGGSADGRRFAIEDDYRQLVKLKNLCKAVFVPSQQKRSDHRDPGLTSTSEAFAKAFYADGMLTVQRMGAGVGEWSRVRSKVVKNRFGPVDREATFDFNYETLEWQLSEEQRQSAGRPAGAADWEDLE